MLSEVTKSFDLSFFVIWTMRSAVERTSETSNGRDGCCKILVFIFERQYRGTEREREKSFDANLAQNKEKFKDKGWKGFNAKRLEVWKTALQ